MRTSSRQLGEVAVGGALGALARYGVGVAAGVSPGAFPWPTLLINVVGSFALGVLVARLPRYRSFLGVGFLGAFTTMSTFAVETDLLVRDGHLDVALAYVAASAAGGVAAFAAGASSRKSTAPPAVDSTEGP